jgi:hypothetical protein
MDNRKKKKKSTPIHTPAELSYLWTSQHWVGRASDSSGHHRDNRDSKGTTDSANTQYNSSYTHIPGSAEERKNPSGEKELFARIHI